MLLLFSINLCYGYVWDDDDINDCAAWLYVGGDLRDRFINNIIIIQY